jgi:hypothetical protein
MLIPLQEVDLCAHPLSRTSSLVDTKNLQTLEGMGGVGARLRCFGIHPNYSRGIENRDTCLAVMCESATRNHAHPDARQARAQAFLYHWSI